jgi:TRAP transporter TAXI family solute receptor
MSRPRGPVVVLAAVPLLLSLAGCAETPAAQAPTTVTIATGSLAGVYYPLGTSLAKIYSARVPGVRGQAIQTGASPENVNAVEAGTADIAFALGDTAYIAYTEGTRLQAAPHRRLRSIAVLYTNASHFFVAPGSRIRSLSDLTGARVAYGVATVVPGRSRSLDLLLLAHGVDPATVTVRAALFADIISGVTDGTIDVGVISAGYPVPAIEAGARAGLRFLDVDPVAVERVRENHPFFLPLTIPPRTYSAQESPIETVGVDNVLLCRADLDEELVYRLTKAFFEALPDLAATHPSAGLIDADLAPATAIPLHAGAARYYRERELLLY